MTALDVFIPGIPCTKGSWIGVTTKTGRVAMRAANKAEKAWAQTVAWTVKAKMLETRIKPITKPAGVAVRLIFHMRKPDSPTNRFPMGDLDKLMRSVLDALSGIAYQDDGQVTNAFVEKQWADGKSGLDLSLEEVTW